MTQGAPREGKALLQGIVWCGLCGAKMGVNSYSVGENRRPSYICNHSYQQEGASPTCQCMSSTPIDAIVTALFVEAMAPAELDVTLKALEQLRADNDALKRQWEAQITQARYEASLAERQYNAVDPDNRLVAHTLETRWNEKLETLQELEHAYADACKQERFSITCEEERRIKELAGDLPKVWSAPTTTNQERKQLLRYAVSEVQLDGVTTPGMIEIRVTWRSGAVTTRTINRLKVGSWAPKTSEIVVERIRQLASSHTLSQIADKLNAEGLRTAHGKNFREHHLRYIARSRGIFVTTSAERLPPPQNHTSDPEDRVLH